MGKEIMAKLYIIMYHYIRSLKSSRYPEIRGLDLELFRQQLAFLKEHFTFLKTEEVLALGSADELKQDSVLLTFDDGYIDHYTNVFPLLKAENIPGFFSMPGRIIREKKVLDVNKIHFILASAPVEKIKAMAFKQLDHYRGAEFDIPPNAELYEKLAKANRFDSGDVIFYQEAASGGTSGAASKQDYGGAVSSVYRSAGSCLCGRAVYESGSGQADETAGDGFRHTRL